MEESINKEMHRWREGVQRMERQTDGERGDREWRDGERGVVERGIGRQMERWKNAEIERGK